VAVADPVEDDLLGQRRELGDPIRAEHLPTGVDRAADGVRGVVRRGAPAVDVAADPGRVELAEALDRLCGPGPEQRVVATEQEAVGAGCRSYATYAVKIPQVAVAGIEEWKKR
jgi:hypothetical protein